MGIALYGAIFVSVLVTSSSKQLKYEDRKAEDFYYGRFPDGFFWGASSASYQYEGGWNAGGKGLSIWDVFTHIPGNIVNNETGDVTCDSYHKYKEDIALLVKLGVSHYRFSLSWPRLIPDPITGVTNPQGIAFYNTFINDLLAAGIQPLVTIYHYDLPQTLQDAYRGWLSPITADYFLSYADLVFRLFGDRVKLWLTFNEPLSFLYEGLGRGDNAPGIADMPTAPYQGSKNVLLAHAKAWHHYNSTYRAKQKGKVGMCFATKWMEPKNPQNASDVAAADRAQQFTTGWLTHPIYGGGDYPAVMKEYVARKSREQGLNESRLPEFTPQEVQFIKGTYDYIGLNYYTTRLVQSLDTGISNPGLDGDQDTLLTVDPSWPKSPLAWLYVVPWGFRKLTNWVKRQYGDVPIVITENGFADGTGEVEDDDRIDFYRQYIDELLKATNLDGCNVVGYSTWSLLDNFEWRFGYTAKFGLHYVNFSDPARPRVPKKSAAYYTQIVKNNGFPSPESTRLKL